MYYLNAWELKTLNFNHLQIQNMKLHYSKKMFRFYMYVHVCSLYICILYSIHALPSTCINIWLYYDTYKHTVMYTQKHVILHVNYVYGVQTTPTELRTLFLVMRWDLYLWYFTIDIWKDNNVLNKNWTFFLKKEIKKFGSMDVQRSHVV